VHLSKLEHRGTINYFSTFSLSLSLSLSPPSTRILSRHLGIFSGADKVVQAHTVARIWNNDLYSKGKSSNPNASTIERQIRTRQISFTLSSLLPCALRYSGNRIGNSGSKWPESKLASSRNVITFQRMLLREPISKSNDALYERPFPPYPFRILPFLHFLYLRLSQNNYKCRIHFIDSIQSSFPLD